MMTSLLAAALLGAAPGHVDPYAPGTVYTAPIGAVGNLESTGDPVHEDSPLWDCRVMGNGVCGPGATVPLEFAPGVYVLVPHELAPTPAR